jgi:hypothetical protein
VARGHYLLGSGPPPLAPLELLAGAGPPARFCSNGIRAYFTNLFVPAVWSLGASMPALGEEDLGRYELTAE